MSTSSSDPDESEISIGASGRKSRLRAAQPRLHLDLITVQVVRAFEEDGVRSIVLKGPAIATWLYRDDEPRPYVDIDLLVAPAQMKPAERALTRLGFERLVDERVVGAFSEPHAVTWRRQRDRTTVDLHWRIPGIAADPRRAWELLSSGTEDVRVAGGSLEALGRPARALHVVLHALHDGREAAKPMADLARVVERISEPTWAEASRLAAQLDATEQFAAGLRLTSEGALVADRFGLPRAVSARLALWAQTPPPGALRLHDFTTAPGIRSKVRLLRAVLAPPPEYIRSLYPSARGRRFALALAYLRRPLAGIRNAPRAVTALRRARAQARTSRGGK